MILALVPVALNLQGRAADLRKKNFRYSVASSLSSKVTSAALQIIAMPIAAVALGVHGFALYAMLTAAVGWLTLSNLGIGPTLVVKLATARVHNDESAERSLFTSAFLVGFLVSAFVSVAVVVVVWLLPVQSIFGPLYVNDAHEIRRGITLLALLFFLQTNLSLFESAQAGFQEQYVQNMFSTVSALPAILAVLAAAKYSPSPVSLILALNGPLVLFRLANAALILRRHPHISPSINAFRWPVCKELVRSGAVYSLAGGVGNFLAHVFPVILVGRAFASEASASFAATMNAIIIASGVVSMLSTPLWPAIADSMARGEREWAVSAYRRLLRVAMAFGIFVALFFALKGEWLFQLWYRNQIHPSQMLLVTAGIYFMMSCWETAHFSILVGLNKVATASILVCVRAVAGVVVTSISMTAGGEATPFLVMIFAIIFIDAVPMRMLVLRSLKN